ncbi:hypothetical protein [Capillimicrobium parvum]|nr:hypothetical protein [Capillimicrobium parvum]
MSRRAALLAAVLSAGAAGLCAAALGAPAPSGDAAGSGWPALSRRIAAHWPGAQRENGAYFDPGLGCAGCARYGEAFLAYGLLLNGVRDHDAAMVRSALQAIDYAIAKYPTPPQGCPDGSPFEDLALAASYNLMRRNQTYRSLFAPRRAAWAQHLRRVQWRHIGGSRYCNKTLVESVMTLELLRTGLTCTCPGAVLHDRARARSAVEFIVNHNLVQYTAAHGQSLGGGLRGVVLSDPPAHPRAYVGLSLGMYARAIELLGRRASSRARRVLLYMANAQWAAAAPDGATAYWGRSQEEAWAASLTAYGAEVAARFATSKRARARYVALANREIDRIELVHGFGGVGLNIVPAAREDPTAVRRVDEYASNIPYIGLTLAGLDWAIAARTPGRTASGIAADTVSSRVLGTGSSRFAVVRRPTTWYAVRMTSGYEPTTSRPASDFRYDFGLVELKQLREGRWIEAVPQRPYTHRLHHPDSAGPVLLHRSARLMPFGTSIHAHRNGTVSLGGGFATPAGAVVRRTRFVYRPQDGGLVLRWRTHRGDRYEVSRFIRSPHGPFTSGLDAHLRRERRIVVARRRVLEVRYPGAPALQGGCIESRLAADQPCPTPSSSGASPGPPSAPSQSPSPG